jgi:dolichol-phosphate mannosyltransferase
MTKPSESERPLISIVVPCYNEAPCLPLFFERFRSLRDSLPKYRLECIFVDDASDDDSPAVLRDLSSSDPDVKFLRLVKRSGSHTAIFAGLKYSLGKAVMAIPCDLQDPPEILAGMLNHWERGTAVIWGARQAADGVPLTDRIFSRAYYLIIRFLTAVPTPPIRTGVFLADRKAVQAVISSPEKQTSLFLLLASFGFRNTLVTYTKGPRSAGRSKWSFSQKLKVVVDSVLAFSDAPVRFMTIIGFCSSMVGLAFAAVLTARVFAGTVVPPDPWIPAIIVVLIMSGIQMVMLGILGEYLWRTFDESRRRPRYIVEETANLKGVHPGNQEERR